MGILVFAPVRSTTRESTYELLKTELALSPERVSAIWRTVLACVLTALCVLVFQLPNGFLAVFYALALSRREPDSVTRNAVSMVIANAIGIAFSVSGIVLFSDFPLLHFLFTILSFYIAFLVARIVTNPNVGFGFGIIVIAASSVNIIWTRGYPARPDLGTAWWTGFGMMLGTVISAAIEWLFRPSSKGTSKLNASKDGLFRHGAFENTEYLRFACKGCAAATMCYVMWSAIGWPGVGVCTVTCFLASPFGIPETISRIFSARLVALIIGGVVFGIGSQVFLLPHVDSIVGFVLILAFFSAVAAWAGTAGPRFFYFGRQIALAYYLTIFQSFGVNASLTMSRDRLMGILFGLIAMWIVFAALPGNPSIVQRHHLNPAAQVRI